MVRSLMLLLAPLLCLAGVAHAINDIEINASCVPGQIHVSIVLLINDPLPADWVGWVLLRQTLGSCAEPVEITPVYPFPAVAGTWHVYDAPPHPDLHQRYVVRAVDTEGAYRYLTLPDFPPGYYATDYAGCGSGPAARGTVTDLGYTLGLDVCDEGCWLPMSFLSGYPADLAYHIGEVVDIYGSIEDEFEGPYIMVDGYAVVGECGPVSIRPQSWGAVRRSYR